MKRYTFLILFLSFMVLSSKVFCEEDEKVISLGEDIDVYSVNVLKEISLPKGYHEGLLINDGEIWVNNGEGGDTWAIDISTGDIVSNIIPAGTFTEGITRGPAGELWATDWNTKSIYKVELQGEKIVPLFEISTEPAHPAGIVSDGKKLYVITWPRGIGTKYHLLVLDLDGKLLDKIRINDIPEPSQLVWDGENIWISSWFNRRVYKIDRDSYEITGYFRTKIKETTGIAWDGKTFWVTGTSADLYQMEIVDSEGKK